MRRLRQCSRGLLVFLMFVVGLLAVGLLFPLCRAVSGAYARRMQDQIQCGWYRVLLKVLNVRVRCFGRTDDEAGLWVCNHVSWLDIVVLGAQRPLTFVAKSEVGAWPVIGFMARRNGTLLVRRGDAASSRRTAEAMAWVLRQSRRVMLFPEGTSSSGDEVLRFHSRLFQAAILVGAKVQPIALAYRGESRPLAPFVGDDAFLPHLWNLLAVEKILIEVTFCHALCASHYSRSDLARATRRQIADVLSYPLGQHLSGQRSSPAGPHLPRSCDSERSAR